MATSSWLNWSLRRWPSLSRSPLTVDGGPYTWGMSKVETSPGGVGFIQTSAAKRIPGMTDDGAKRRRWLTQPAPSSRQTAATDAHPQPRAATRAAKA